MSAHTIRKIEVIISIVLDETTDVDALLDEIDGRVGSLDVASYRFGATVVVPK